MKSLALAFLLLTSVSGWAGSPPSASTYTIDVHVSTSEMLFEGGGFSQILHVLINGKQYELRSGGVNALLALGDYKAKLVRDDHRTAYDSFQFYEFLFPDNKTRKFEVIGVME